MYIYCGIPEVVDRQDLLLCQEFNIQNLKKKTVINKQNHRSSEQHIWFHLLKNTSKSP